METMTLEQLKKLNAEQSASETEVDDNEETHEEPEEEAEGSEEETVLEEESDDSEEDSEESEAEEVELWQQSEESEDSQDDGKSGFVPNPAAKKLRLKAKAYREERDQAQEELQRLKDELEKLKSGAIQQHQPQELKRPKLEDYDFDDEKYQEALDEYYERKLELKLSNVSQQSKQAEVLAQQQKQLESAVETHYSRAEELVRKHNLKEEDYANADGLIRSTIESVMPGKGDAIADQLIAKLVNSGEGSEKAWFYLGRNAKELGRLRKSIEDDPSGLSAAIMLGELRAKATKPIRVKSKAPEPQKRLKGDASVKMSQLYKQWKKSTDVSERIRLKREAKKRGEDVSKW